MGLFVALILGFASAFIMLIDPSPEDMLSHTKRYVWIYHKAPYMMHHVLKELKCCGVKEYGDIFTKMRKPINYFSKDPEMANFYRIPPGCCKGYLKACKKWVHEMVEENEYESKKDEYLYMKPCLKKGETFAKIKQTRVYAEYSAHVGVTACIFIFIFGVIGVLNYYIWWKFPRMPEDDRPWQFNHDVRALMRCQCSQVKQSIEKQHKREEEDREALIEGKALQKHPSDFAVRHEKVMMSLMNMKQINKDTKLTVPQYLQLGQNSRSNTALKTLSKMKLLDKKNGSKTNLDSEGSKLSVKRKQGG